LAFLVSISFFTHFLAFLVSISFFTHFLAFLVSISFFTHFLTFLVPISFFNYCFNLFSFYFVPLSLLVKSLSKILLSKKYSKPVGKDSGKKEVIFLCLILSLTVSTKLVLTISLLF